MDHLVVHGKRKSANEILIHESDQFGLVVAFYVGRLAILALIGIRMNAGRSNEYHTVWLALARHAVDELVTVLDLEMLDDIHRQRGVMFAIRFVFEDRLMLENDIITFVHRTSGVEIMLVYFKACHVLNVLR